MVVIQLLTDVSLTHTQYIHFKTQNFRNDIGKVACDQRRATKMITGLEGKMYKNGWKHWVYVAQRRKNYKETG